MLWACVNAIGQNEGVYEMDVEAAEAHPVAPGCRLVPIGEHQAEVLKFIGHRGILDADGRWCLSDERCGQRWDMARRMHFRAAIEESERRERIVADLRGRGALARAGFREIIGPPAPDPPAVQRPYHFEPVSPRPRLAIRLIEPADIDGYVAQVVEHREMYEEGDVRVGTRAAIWCLDPWVWPLIHEWNGKPIQYETYHFAPGLMTVRSGFTAHTMRERPHWFWQRLAASVFGALRDVGMTRIVTRVRLDRRDWIEVLLANYRGREIGRSPDGHFAELEYTVADALAVASQPWPARPTAGPTWRWTHAGAELTLQEAPLGALAALRTELAETWGGEGHPALPIVRRALDEQSGLDQATVVVGRVRGRLVGAFCLRPRRPDTVHSAILTRFGDPEPADGLVWRVIYRGVCDWARIVGYNWLTGMIPDATYDNPAFHKALKHLRTAAVRHHMEFRVPMVEVRHDLTAIAAEPLAAWEVWDPDRPDLPLAKDVPT